MVSQEHSLKKVKKEYPDLPESVMTTCIRQFGLRECHVPQDRETQMLMDLTVRREFISNEYGGPPQGLFSRPRQEKINEHGISLFLYPQLGLHPLAPQRPGYPGLIFSCSAKVHHRPWTSSTSFVLFAGLNAGVWLYVGECEFKGYGRLPRHEWQALSYPVG